MLWFVLAAMTAIAVAIALWSLVFGRSKRDDSHAEVAFYSERRAEIGRDVERGQLPPSEANAALYASTSSRRDGSRRRIAAALVVLILLVVGIGLYVRFGRPDLPDAPLASRAVDSSAPDAVEAAVAHVEAEVSASPDNVKAWSALAPVYVRLGRYDDAVAAYRQLLRLKGEDGALRAELGEAEVAAAGGVVTADARSQIDQALADSPGLPMARFYHGLAAEQDGDAKKAIEIYRSLLGETQDRPHWRFVMQARLAALTGEPTVAPAADAAPAANAAPATAADGPAATGAAGASAGGGDMIQAMVARLAARLAQNGGSADEWMRLVRSYAVLHETDKAKDTLASARKALAADANAGASLDALAKEFDLASP